MKPRLALQCILALSLFGTFFSWGLTYVELFVLHAICRWCVASAVIITAIWVLSVATLRDRSAPYAAARRSDYS